jgi:transposase
MSIFQTSARTLRLRMGQRAVTRFFTLKGLTARAIHAELVSVYLEDALALATVKKWNKRFREGRRDLFDDPRSGRPLTHDLSEAIRSVLKERPFSSCKVLCRHFRIRKATCLRILHDNLGLKKISSSLGAAHPIVEPEERKSVIFERHG